ncbi:MAG: efflux RND transporter periplasmic adaptor subunit [Pseudomonadota bacterium]
MTTKSVLKAVIPLGVIVGAVMITMTLISLRPPPIQVEPEKSAPIVEVVPAKTAPMAYRVQSQGILRPLTRTTVVAEVSGKIEWVSERYVVGGYFDANELLLRIDPSDYAAALKQAEATLAGRQAQLAQEQARAEQASKDWRQLEGRRGNQAPALVLREPQLAEAKANVLAAEADLDRARRNLQRTEIRMPYRGLVEAKDADVGQYVTPGGRLGVTFSTAVAEIRLPLSSDDLAFVDLPAVGETGGQGSLVRLRATLAGQQSERLAQIVRSEQVFDERARVIYAVAQVEDPYNLEGPSSTPAFPIGTFVSADIEGVDAGAVIALPRSTLRDSGEVLVANQQNKLEIRPVTVARADAQNVYIKAGLRDGERVITTAVDLPIPGTELRVQGGTQIPALEFPTVPTPASGKSLPKTRAEDRG